MKRDLPSGKHEANRVSSSRGTRGSASSGSRGGRDAGGWTDAVAKSLEQFDVADTLEDLRHHIDDLIHRLAERDEPAARSPRSRRAPSPGGGEVETQIAALGSKVEAASDLLAELTDLLEAQTERIETIEQQLGDPDEGADDAFAVPDRPEPVDPPSRRHEVPRGERGAGRDAALHRGTASRAPLIEALAATLAQHVASAVPEASPAPAPAEEIPKFRMEPSEPPLDLGRLEAFIEARFSSLDDHLIRLEHRIEDLKALAGERDRQVRDLEERLLILVDGPERGYGGSTVADDESNAEEGLLPAWPPRRAEGLAEQVRSAPERPDDDLPRGGRLLRGPRAHLAPALPLASAESTSHEGGPPSSSPGAGGDRHRVVAGGKRNGRKAGRERRGDVLEASARGRTSGRRPALSEPDTPVLPASAPSVAPMPRVGSIAASATAPVESAEARAGAERLLARLNGEAATGAEPDASAARQRSPRQAPRPLWRQLQDNSRPFPAKPSAALAPRAQPQRGRTSASLEEIVEREVRSRRDFGVTAGTSASDVVRGRKSRPTVMVVDDVADARTILSIYLSKTGYQVVTAASAEDCLAKLRHHDVDAIVLDARLPGASGAHVCRTLSEDPAFERYRGVPVIVYTAHPDEYPRELVEKWHVADYVIKGGDMLPLITALVRHTKMPDDRQQ